MELVTFLIDFILHVDKHLEVFVQNYGVWVYALLFLIVFVETGVVVMPFLPEILCSSWWVRSVARG
jgi:membrane-associated protein